MSRTFKNGIHPNGYKQLSQEQAITVMPAPKDIYIPLSQHIGKPAVALASEGEHVLRGQLIAEQQGAVSANIYSSVSGTVGKIVKRTLANGQAAQHLHIVNDGLNETVKLPRMTKKMSVLQRIKDSGIVGMGGATFPGAVKFSVKDGAIDTLIINGAECEPYITCDYRLMIERAERIVIGARHIASVIGAKRIIIGIEDNKPQAVGRFTGFNDIEVIAIKTKYPQGGEKQLIFACTGRVVSQGKLPLDVGVVVSNVHTAFSICEAVDENKPLYERVMTVSGLGVSKPMNAIVANGTPFSDILEFCGGIKQGEEVVKVISGGPMMGFAQFDLNSVCTKGTSSLLFLTAKEINTENAHNCINCAKCQGACPMNLMPMFIDGYALAKDYENSKKYGALNCIECGSCAFTCPAKRPLVQSIRFAKKMIRIKGL